MLIMVRAGIAAGTLKAPELRPWMFSGGFAPHNQWKLTKGVCGWCNTPAGGNLRRTFNSQWLEILDPDTHARIWRWLWGQCPACQTIFWGVEDERVIAWINGERKFDPRQPIGKKPAINVPGREVFDKVWRAA